MKRNLIFMLLCGCTALCGAVYGQNPAAYMLPQTVLRVEVTVRQEVIRRGPYARFAQQYLGAVAPLSDKELYSFAGAKIDYSTENDPSALYVADAQVKAQQDLRRSPEADCGTIESESSATGGLQVDKMDLSNLSLEASAAEAARTLTTLRRRRFDLVTGEAGENVYGAGMQAALDEMKRLEDEYTALFLGQRTTQLITRTFSVIPQAGTNRVIVCRFSEEGGIVPESDLSGRPVVLELTPENRATSTVANRPSGNPRTTVFVRVADPVRCRLIDDKTVLADERIPLYQFGPTVEVPVSSSK